jgi:hypothetical protein
MVLFSLAMTPILATCGGGSGSCGKTVPCGGVVVGNWNINSECVNSEVLTMEAAVSCPGATATISGIHVSGTASFNADLTYTMTTTASASAQETLPPSCLTTNGVTLTCAQLDQALQAAIAADPTSLQSAHCSGSSTCTCSFTIPAQMSTTAGTYATAGTSITLSPAGGMVSSNEYCVKGNELHLLAINMTMPMGAMGQANVEAELFLTKR